MTHTPRHDEVQMNGEEPSRGHGHDHGHGHAGAGKILSVMREIFAPHSHDAVDALVRLALSNEVL